MPAANNIDVDIAESHLDLDERIRRRAYQIHLTHPETQNRELDDWLEAEREILGEAPKDSAEDRATVVGSARRPGIVL